MNTSSHKPVFWNMQWIAYATLGGLALYAFSTSHGLSTWLIAILLCSILALFKITLPETGINHRSRYFFVLESLLALVMLIICRGSMPYQVVFFILSVQATNLYSYRASRFWIVGFIIATCVIFLIYFPLLDAIINSLIFSTGYWFWGTLALVSIEADVARRESQELLVRLEEAHRLLREQSVRDPLTGLFNRRYLEETLARETARSQRYNQSLSLFIIDIDHFKNLNDTYGHLAGDQVLKTLAAFLQGNCRADDIVCRFGGEEFIVVMPGLEIDVAIQRATEWCQDIANLMFPWEGKTLQITVSFGIANSPRHAQSGDGLIARADEALYQAKRGGRNRVMVYTPEAVSAADSHLTLITDRTQ